MDKFGLNSAQLEILQNIFKKYPNLEKVLIFGSRASDNFKPYSDIDLCLFGKIKPSDLDKINNDIVQSNLLFYVDLVYVDDVKDQKISTNINKYGKVLWEKA
jgi:predicted nucleotidyltransferase